MRIGNLSFSDHHLRRSPMYIARFSYDVQPIHRQQAIAFIEGEVASAKARGLAARLLIPLTRAPGGPALQYEVELDSLDTLDDFRSRGMGSAESTSEWMREFSALLTAPPAVEILRVAEQH
jgi:hypothetical protein